RTPRTGPRRVRVADRWLSSQRRCQDAHHLATKARHRWRLAVEEHVGGVIHPGLHMHLARHPCRFEPAGVVDVLGVEEIDVTDADPRGREAPQVLTSGRSDVRTVVVLTRWASEIG